MIEPVAVYLDWTDHDAIERELDEQMGLSPKPPKWRPVGPALTCGHAQISRKQLGRGFNGIVIDEVACACGHFWREASS